MLRRIHSAEKRTIQTAYTQKKGDICKTDK